MTAGCERFEHEGLLRLERGLPLGEHFESCPDCLAARVVYDRLRQGIAAAGAVYEPRPSWQSRVWATIDARGHPAHRRPWLWLTAGAVAAVTIVLIFVLGPRGPLGPQRSVVAGLHVEVQAGAGAVRRGGEAQPGDRLVLRADTAGARHGELRVYRHDTDLVMRCSSEPPCARNGDQLRATLVLDTRGTYQGVLLLSERPLPAPSAGLDRDADAAIATGAEVHLGAEVRVR